MPAVTKKTAVQLRREIADARREVQGMISRSEREERDLTDAEFERAEQLNASVDAARDQLPEAIEAERRRLQASGMASKIDRIAAELGPIGDGGFSGGWQVDGRGGRYVTMQAGQKATDFLRPPSDCENAVGHFIGAKLFGPNKNTPQSVIQMIQTSTSNASGGFTVPIHLHSEIVDKARSKSVLERAGCSTVLMDGPQLHVPALVEDAEMKTKSEGGPFNRSKLKFGTRILSAMTGGCVVELSRELWEDSEELLARQLGTFLAAELARQVDEWGLSGSASAEPQGILQRDIDNTDSDSVGAIDWTDLSDAATKVRERNHEPTVAIMHTTIRDDLLSIETGDGTNSARGWLGKPPTLENVTLLETTHCPLAKAIIGDFSN